MIYRSATNEDVDTIMKIVNAAHQVETGDTHLAFKRTPRLVEFKKGLRPTKSKLALLSCRYRNTSLCLSDIPHTLLGFLQDGTIVCCGKGEVDRTRDIVNLGPLAVDPKYQGKGYGKTLLEKLESLATNQELHCVSCRTDVLAIYKKRGYVIVETTPMAEVIKRNVPDLSELTVTRKDISVHTMMRTK